MTRTWYRSRGVSASFGVTVSSCPVSQQSEDIVREVSFLLERCVLRPLIFERAQEEATDWRCVVCGSVAQDPVDLLLTSGDFDWEAECEVYLRNM